MKLRFEPAIEHHRTRIAVLSRQVTFQQSGRPGLAIAGNKMPIAILTRRASVTTIYRPSGGVIPIDEFLLRFPGQRASLQKFEHLSD